MVDSNHRRRSQQIYSLSPLATREIPHIRFLRESGGAGRRTRTPDLLITNQLLYQLSYTSVSHRARPIIALRPAFVKHFFAPIRDLFYGGEKDGRPGKKRWTFLPGATIIIIPYGIRSVAVILRNKVTKNLGVIHEFR